VTDSHAHLDALDDPDAAVARAHDTGVTRIVTIGTGVDSCRRALAIAERQEGVVAVLGIDPHQASGAEAGRLDEVRELLSHPQAVAVGETGLDGFHRHAEPTDQQRLFEEHLALAEELGKPVVIHCREAARETAVTLQGFSGTVVLHCFSEPELLAPALEHGWYVSFAGNVTYPRSAELRELAARVPATRVLAETDSPYLAPQGLRGRPNEPAHIVHTLRVLAEARGEAPEELGHRIDANATAAFGLAS
jgi:TatD DNase family protein